MRGSYTLRIKDSQEQDREAIIDTGAEVNLLDAKLVTEVQKSTHTGIIDVGGKWISVLGEGKTELVTKDGKRWEVEGLVMQKTPIILGLPFLRKYKAVIYCSTGFMQLNRNLYQLQLCPGYAIRTISQISQETMDQVTKATSYTNFNEENLEELRSILIKYRDLWENEDKIGRTNLAEHKIELTTSLPVSCRPGKYAEEQRNTIENEVEVMLKKGVIRPSQSPYASGIVLVKKKTGD